MIGLGAIAGTILTNVASFGIDAVTSLFKDASEGAVEKMADVISDVSGIDLKDKNLSKNITPEMRLKFEEAAMKHKEVLEGFKVKHHELHNANVQGARDTEYKILTSETVPKSAKTFRHRFAVLVWISSIAYITAATFLPALGVAEVNQRIADIMTGAMLSNGQTIIEYYFGDAYKH